MQTDLWSATETADAGADMARLEARLRSRLGSRVRNLQFILVENGLVLRGKAASYYVKQLAQHEVMRAADVPIVANEIEVESEQDFPQTEFF